MAYMRVFNITIPTYLVPTLKTSNVKNNTNNKIILAHFNKYKKKLKGNFLIKFRASKRVGV
jgi:hypothetical protein